MLGLLYIIMNVAVGFVLCALVMPGVITSFSRKTYSGEKINLSPVFLLFPIAYVTGAFLMTWLTYATSYLAMRCGSENPLLIGNLVVFTLAAVFIAAGLYRLNCRKRFRRFFVFWKKPDVGDYVFLGVTLAFTLFLMYWTFFYQQESYGVGVSVFSDFAPHLGMIRSFSKGNNFPTSYSHFAGEDIKYHFLFQFMVGNLEFLGLRLDHAFNIPSVLCFASAFWLLYVLSVKLTGKRAVGYLAGGLFAFRSSDAIFDFFANPDPEKVKVDLNQEPAKISAELWQKFRDNSEFIGTTEHEDWGLWNLNVYCNQRHLAIGLCAMLIVIILLMPLLYRGIRRVQENILKRQLELAETDPDFTLFPIEKVGYSIRYSLLDPKGWMPRSYIRPIFLGVFFGMCCFFNGACVIGCLCVLFLLAVIADHRLEFAIVAVITVIMTMIATRFFINGSVVSTKFQAGFLADLKTFAGSWEYIMTLCGILPFVLLAGFLISGGLHKWIWVSFTAPFIFAFTVSLTRDITVNHKYIMMSLMLLAIPAAVFLVWLYEKRGMWMKITAIALAFILMATGLYDLRTVIRRNDHRTGQYLRFSVDDPITNWVMEHNGNDRIYLTAYYSLNEFVMGGAMLYCGHTYYAWSAGYDTDAREKHVKAMYEAKSPVELVELTTKYHIHYIVVDQAAKESPYFRVNESVIRATFPVVFTSGSTVIYTTDFAEAED